MPRAKANRSDRSRAGPSISMSSGASLLLNRLIPTEATSRRDRAAFCCIATLHVAALIMMATTEVDLVAKAAFLLVWALLNFFWLWDRIEENVFADDVTNALAKIFPNDPPRFLARTPHGYHDTALIRSELEEAGFSRMIIETRAEQSRASSPRIPAVAYCQGTLLRNEIEAREAGKLEAATDYVASAIADKHGRGEVAAKIQAHVIVAVV